MRTLSCVFYIFLLSLFGLSCFGFPTDNWPAGPYSNYLVRRFGTADTIRNFRIRHRRRDLMGTTRMVGHIDPVVIANEEEPPTREQRSTKRRNKQKNHHSKHSKQQPRLEPHITLKAYTAPIVVKALAQQNGTNTIGFHKKEVFKGTIREKFFKLQFCRNHAECDTMRKQTAKKVVKLKKIDLNKDYILFLNVSNGSRGYENMFVPELFNSISEKELILMTKVCTSDFKAATPDLEIVEKYNETENQLRLICRAKNGLPRPKLKWVRNNKREFSNRTTITYRKKRLKLTIKNLSDEDLGNYTCEATGVGRKVSISKFVTKPRKHSDGIPHLLDPPCETNRCDNGAKCYESREIREWYCVCPDGFKGRQCEYKDVKKPVNNTADDESATG